METGRWIDLNRFRALLKRAILIPAISCGVISIFFFLQLSHLGTAFRWVQHSDQVISLAYRAQASLIESENQLRGRLLLGRTPKEPIARDLFERAIAELERSLASLAGLVIDNPAQGRLIGEISQVNRIWIEAARSAVAQVATGVPLERARLSPEDRAQMVLAKTLMTRFIQIEEELRNRRAREARRSSGLSLWIGLGMLLAICVIFAVLIRRSLLALSRTYGNVLEGMEARAKELQSAVRSRDDFLSVASHELKTPLTSLKLQLEMIQRIIHKSGKEELPLERVVRAITMGTDQANRLTDLINDLLDISKIQAGRVSYYLEKTDLTVLVQQAIDRMEESAKSYHSKVWLETSGPVFVDCDRLRIDQVISNLITNALKYGGGRPIRVQVDHFGDQARITVIDQGIGIDPSKHQLIFERFERAVSSDGISGLGLGLYIVRQIVEAHRGRVEVQSALGKGSVFTVTLPLAQRSTGDVSFFPHEKTGSLL